MNSDTMDFGSMLRLLKEGGRFTRTGWNGAGQYIYFVPAATYPAVTDAAKVEFADGVPYRAYIALRTADAHVIPWLASQTDLLSADWQQVS